MRLCELAGVALVASAVLGACGDEATPADYKAEAERLIVTTGHDRPVVFQHTECDQPPDTRVGTTFECTTSDTFATQYVFTATITGKGTFELRGAPKP
jgi:hypothetical protein